MLATIAVMFKTKLVESPVVPTFFSDKVGDETPLTGASN
jgi:hypothetical protein